MSDDDDGFRRVGGYADGKEVGAIWSAIREFILWGLMLVSLMLISGIFDYFHNH